MKNNSDKPLESLFKSKRVADIARGKIIVYEGHNVNHVYYVVSGYVKVYTIAGANLQRIPFIYKTGDIFPLTTFLSGDTIARFFYEAMTPLKVQSITSRQLEHKVKDNLELGEQLIRYTSRMDEQFIRRVNELISIGNPLKKVKNLLLFLMQQEHSRKDFVDLNFKLSARDLASMCSISREEAIKQLGLLKSAQIIATSGSTIVDKQKLLNLKTS